MSPRQKSEEDQQEEDVQTPAAPQIDPWAVLDRLASALESARQSPAAAQNEQLMERLTAALERVSESNIKGTEMMIQENRALNRRSNETPPLLSVFNRRGVLLPDNAAGPRKPPLKCPMFIPFIVEWESINREEAELLNLLEPGEYNLSLTDKSRVKIGIKMEYTLGGKPSRLLLRSIAVDGTPGTAFNKDNFHLVPALSDMLRQLLRQHEPKVRAMAAAIMSDEEEEALIEAGEITVSM